MTDQAISEKFSKRLIKAVSGELLWRRHKHLAQLSKDTALAWDRYVQTDVRPRPIELRVKACELNDQLLEASQKELISCESHEKSE